MDDLIGMEDIKQEVLHLEDMIRNRAEYQSHNIDKPFNVMLTGPAGTGKTKLVGYLAKRLERAADLRRPARRSNRAMSAAAPRRSTRCTARPARRAAASSSSTKRRACSCRAAAAKRNGKTTPPTRCWACSTA